LDYRNILPFRRTRAEDQSTNIALVLFSFCSILAGPKKFSPDRVSMSSSPLPVTGRSRAAVVEELRRLLPRMESVGAAGRALPLGLDAIDAHLPHGGLAVGALHEVAPHQHGDTPAAFGFLVTLLARFAPTTRPVLLIASHRVLADHGRPHGHGLQQLGLDPARLILVETRNDQQTFWALEEALRSRAPAAIGGAAARLDLKTSQRLHLVAGDAGLPLVLLRPAQADDASAAATRWCIGAAEAARDRFGLLTRTRWRARLERCRNGRPGEWLVEFDHAAYRFSLAPPLADPALSRRAGAHAVRRAG
jgi:protein ImuA